jgi:hypothetical protein
MTMVIITEIVMTISRINWSHPPSHDVAKARLIGRERYNTWRREAAGARREQVLELLLVYGWDTPGVLGWIAAQLLVSPSTICRDRQKLLRTMGLADPWLREMEEQIREETLPDWQCEVLLAVRQRQAEIRREARRRLGLPEEEADG